MHILLINANPVVSRLLVLCTRDDAVVLNEVSTVEDIQRDMYDVVFVDEASYGRNVADFLVKFSSAKKIFISYRSDAMRGFDETIKKPFLPSQITDIIKDVEVPKREELLEIEDEALEEEKSHIFPLSSDEDEIEEKENIEVVAPMVLDSAEIEKIKELLDMEDVEENKEALSDEALEARKVELIKEQLISDGLEIIEEDEIVAELNIDLDGILTKKKKPKVKKSKKEKKNKKIKFTKKNMERIEDAVEMAMATMTKKQMKKLLKGKEIEVSVKLEDNH